MRPRISVREPVCPSIRPFVCNALFLNARNCVFSTSVGEGMRGEEAVGEVAGRTWRGRRGVGKGVTRGPDASDVWPDQTCFLPYDMILMRFFLWNTIFMQHGQKP